MKIRRLFWALCFGVISLQGLLFAQDRVRFVTDAKQFPGQPIEILGKAIGSKKLKPDGEVLAGQDWMKNFSLEFKNISRKNITGAYMHFEIAATGKMNYPLIMPIVYSVAQDKNPAVRSRNALRPGESTTVGMAHYQNVVLALKSMGITDTSDITSAKLSVRSVDFDDDSRWNVGFINRRDPNNPDKWIQSTGNEKPAVFFEVNGVRHANVQFSSVAW